ncbi:LexA family protein [Azospirillum sp. B510]|uniref:LexA family protein n=1 Tax=Azospirillum sp. (strain B510) TaxID=137722 RepID=UPI0002E7D4E0|nr:hypothetical protein [Azospirillum sp. B510]
MSLPNTPPPNEPGSPAHQAALAAVVAFAAQVMNARPLLPAQLDCLRVLSEWINDHGIAPTLTQLATELDMSKGQARAQLRGLVRKGWITRGWGRARSIAILRDPPMPDFTDPVFLLSDETTRC